MALQRAGIQAVVYEAHTPTSQEAGSYLTVAINGLDALRAIDADTPVLHAGFPTPTNLLYSSRGRRLGAVSNGGVLPDGTTAHTIKRARLYRRLHQQATGRGIQVGVDGAAARAAGHPRQLRLAGGELPAVGAMGPRAYGSG
jgi:2-polyprenyl-6-methoxyphenol hydroxylase-like FAD-dependent oxidoreductase